jgi:toxin FitB
MSPFKLRATPRHCEVWILSKGFLLDTSVISALAPGRETYLAANMRQWLQAHHHQLFLPAVAVAEIAQGISKLRQTHGANNIAKADRLDHWLDGLLTLYADRILPLDTQAARLAGQISDAAIASGRHPGFADVAIAAIAQHRQLLLLTANLKHFEPLGVACQNPLLGLPMS